MDNMGRWCQVPGQNVVDAYCEIVKLRDLNAEDSETWQLVNARLLGFRQAVEIYCPSVPRYTSTGGYLIMQGNLRAMNEEADNG